MSAAERVPEDAGYAETCYGCADVRGPAPHSCPPHLDRPLLRLAPGAEYRSPHAGKQIGESFAELVQYVSRPLVSREKEAHGGLVLGRFREEMIDGQSLGVRRLTYFVGTSMLGLDYDDGKETAFSLHAAIEGLHLVYSTFSSTPGRPKSRAILFLDREIDRDTHKRMMRAIYAKFAEAGATFDPSAKDATRWWFAPVVHPERADAHEVHASPYSAPPVSVDLWLAHADRIDAAYAAELAERRRLMPKSAASTDAQRNALDRGALRSGRERVLAAGKGERHEVLNREAHSLAREELGLSEDDIEDELVPAFVAVAGPEREREARRTVHDAYRAARGGA